MGVMKRAILSVWRKKTKTLLFLITVIVISCFEFGINSTKNAQIAIQNSVQAAAQRSFRIEVNLTDYRQRLMDIPVTRLPNGATLSKMPNNQFGSVLMEDIQSIAQVEGIQFYNITTAPFAVNPYNFKRIEDIESDQYEDQQAVTLIGNLKMNQDREILNGTLKLKEGRWGDENDSNVCVISDEIAKMNELNIGDELQFNDYKDRENSSVCRLVRLSKGFCLIDIMFKKTIYDNFKIIGLIKNIKWWGYLDYIYKEIHLFMKQYCKVIGTNLGNTVNKILNHTIYGANYIEDRSLFQIRAEDIITFLEGLALYHKFRIVV